MKSTQNTLFRKMSKTVMSRQDETRESDAMFKTVFLSEASVHRTVRTLTSKNLIESIQKYKHLYYFNQNDHCQMSGRGKK